METTMQKIPTPNGERNHLARVRRAAKKRGFKVRKDWSGAFNLITESTVPPRALAGLEHVGLTEIEAAVSTPLPPPKPVRIAVGRLTEKAQSPQASHPALSGFASLVESVLKSNGGPA
jgi:hypothetical protein